LPKSLRCLVLSLGGGMRRRKFITLIGGAAAAWPLAAWAQQGERMRRVGVLIGLAADDPQGQATLETLLQALQRLGWVDGRNVKIVYRWSGRNAEDARKYATELVTLGPDVLVATGGATMGALFQATRSIPIVFANVPDPVGSGFVESLSRPGGNTRFFAVRIRLGRKVARIA